MRKFIGLTLTLTLGLTELAAAPVAAQSDNSRNNIGDQEDSGRAGVYTPTDVATWEVSVPAGSDGDSRNGRLTPIRWTAASRSTAVASASSSTPVR